eukprot:897761_1
MLAEIRADCMNIEKKMSNFLTSEEREMFTMDFHEIAVNGQVSIEALCGIMTIVLSERDADAGCDVLEMLLDWDSSGSVGIAGFLVIMGALVSFITLQTE